MFYLFDSERNRQESLKTKDRQAAAKILHAKNESPESRGSAFKSPEHLSPSRHCDAPSVRLRAVSLRTDTASEYKGEDAWDIFQWSPSNTDLDEIDPALGKLLAARQQKKPA